VQRNQFSSSNFPILPKENNGKVFEFFGEFPSKSWQSSEDYFVKYK
jgi:hypothetical protein